MLRRTDSGPTKVALLCLEAPREGQASYTHVHEIVHGLERSGWSVAICSPRHSGRWQRPSLPRRILSYLMLQLGLLWVVPRVDIVYIRAHPLALLAALEAALFRKPVFHEVNGTYRDVYVAYPAATRFRWLLTPMQRWQYRHATGLIAVTDGLAAWARAESGGRPTKVIPNGANTEIFHPGARTERALPRHYAVFVGGLTIWHGIDMMRAAVADPRWPADLPLVVAGDGPMRAAVEDAARETSRILPLGRVPYREVPGILAGASIGLVPITDPGGRSSLAGISPLKLYELLACAVPVVVTDLPGLSEIVRDEDCGLVVPVGDAAAMAAAVRSLWSDPDAARAMGERGGAAVHAAHSWAKRADATRAFLTECVEARRA
jgi:glycosyltransferase involved in cell wall biosynthesis